jgi:hypothetical protein
MGSCFPEAVPGRHIPLLVLCRPLAGCSLLGGGHGGLAARTVIVLMAVNPGRSNRVPEIPSSVKWVGLGKTLRRA